LNNNNNNIIITIKDLYSAIAAMESEDTEALELSSKCYHWRWI